MTPHGETPEKLARQRIDAQLVAAGWEVQDRGAENLHAGRGVAVREFALERGHGYADYLLFVDQRAVGVLEAKPEGHTLSGVEGQALRYSEGLPANLDPPVSPLPFVYRSTGAEWQFTNLLDPEPRSREIFAVHRPDTLGEWLAQPKLATWAESWHRVDEVAEGPAVAWPSTLRRRCQGSRSAVPPRRFIATLFRRDVPSSDRCSVTTPVR